MLDPIKISEKELIKRYLERNNQLVREKSKRDNKLLYKNHLRNMGIRVIW